MRVETAESPLARRIAGELPTIFLQSELTEDDVRALSDASDPSGRLHILYVKLHQRASVLRSVACFCSSIGLALAVGVDCASGASASTSLGSLFLQLWTLIILIICLYAPVLHGALPSLRHRVESFSSTWSLLNSTLERAQTLQHRKFDSAIQCVTSPLEIAAFMNALAASFLCWDRCTPEQAFAAEILTQVARATALCAIYSATPRRVLFTHVSYRDWADRIAQDK